jgi:hypothetical protein
MDAEGRIAFMVLIFSGTFESKGKKRLAELSALEKKGPNIKVLFQKKAWMDGQVLTAIAQKFFLPYLRNLWAADGLPFVESYLQLDNGPGRCDEKFLKCLKDDCKTLLDKSPPDKTNYIQMIDDNCGRILRDLACDFIEETVVDMEPAAVKELSVARKREIMVEAAQSAYTKWMDPSNDHVRAIGKRAALRTGLAMRIDNNCEGVRPVRFPEGYSATIPASSGAPVQSYFVESFPATPPVVNLILPPAASAETMRIGINQHPNGTVQVELQGEGSITLTREAPVPVRLQQEVGVFDGWSDEEERVFLDDEVDPSENESSESEDENLPRRKTKCRRWCLCERARGRKCMCELRGGGFCSEKCGCDTSKCRAQLPAESDDSDE